MSTRSITCFLSDRPPAAKEIAPLVPGGRLLLLAPGLVRGEAAPQMEALVGATRSLKKENVIKEHPSRAFKVSVDRGKLF